MEANKLTNKFTAVPIEQDTNILFQLNATLEDYDVLYQVWSWDGVTAESFIFLSSDIADLTDDEVKTLAKSSPMIKKCVYYKDLVRQGKIKEPDLNSH